MSGSPLRSIVIGADTYPPDVNGAANFAHRLATGLASVVAVVDPELVVLSGQVAQAGGERLRELVEAEMTGLALPRPRLRISAVEGDPILIGALQTALADARHTVFDTA